jgi:hypothetical protein
MSGSWLCHCSQNLFDEFGVLAPEESATIDVEVVMDLIFVTFWTWAEKVIDFGKENSTIAILGLSIIKHRWTSAISSFVILILFCTMTLASFVLVAFFSTMFPFLSGKYTMISTSTFTHRSARRQFARWIFLLKTELIKRTFGSVMSTLLKSCC